MERLDFLGKSFSLRVLGEDRHKTIFGGIITIVSAIIFIILFILFGTNFYLRLNPLSTVSNQLSNVTFNYTLNKTNFFYAFRIEDQDNNLLEKPEFFYIEPHYIVYNQTSAGQSIKIIDQILPYHRCTADDISLISDQYLKMNFNSYYCLDKFSNDSLTTGGIYYGIEITQYIKVRVFHCMYGSTRNRTSTVCNNNYTVINDLLKNYIFF